MNPANENKSTFNIVALVGQQFNPLTCRFSG